MGSKYYVAPRNNIQTKLCHIWSDLLGIQKIGITDDFFEIGGDSTLLVRLVERMQNELHLKISTEDLFIYRCIEKLPMNFALPVKKFDEKDKIDWYSPYEKFSSKKSEKTKTIFFFPPGLEGGEAYFNIVHKFSDLDVVLFNNYFIDYKRQQNKTCELTREH